MRPPWAFLLAANTPAIRKACKASHAFLDAAVQRVLDAAEKNGAEVPGSGKQYVFINALVCDTTGKKALRDQCLNVLLTSTDTTACCPSWTLLLLARHSNVLYRLRTEVESISGLRQDAPQSTHEQLKKMKSLTLCSKSSGNFTLLYPSTPPPL